MLQTIIRCNCKQNTLLNSTESVSDKPASHKPVSHKPASHKPDSDADSNLNFKGKKTLNTPFQKTKE